MAFRLTVRDMSAPRKLPAWLYPSAAWLAILAVAVAVGMYASAPDVLVPSGAGRMFPRVPQAPDLRTLLWMLGVGSPVWYAVFVALPLLLWAGRRTDLTGQSRFRVAGLGILALLALVTLTSWMQYAITFSGAPSKPPFAQYLPQALQQNLLPWIALAGIVVAVESRRHAVQLAVERERLRTGMAEQRLVALTSQLQPHFLFNTLQGISTLIHRDPDAADQMLGKLADLLRDVLRDRDRVLVPLVDEIRYARTYLEISKLRFGERLQYDIDVPREFEGIQVPLFILQPLVENAISHGIGSRIQGGHVWVRAYRKGGWVRLDVEDDGGGIDDDVQLKEGIGLSNTRERLRASFGGEGRFQLSRNGKTTIARLEIPEIRAPAR